MRDKLHWFVLGLVVFGLFAFVFFHLFEIVESQEYFPPSREAQVNEYLALDRWLTREGFFIRVQNAGNIETLKAAREGIIFIQSELFDWDEEAYNYLEKWVEEGGSLVLSLGNNRNWENDEELGPFLDRLGLEADTSRGNAGYIHESETPSFGRNIRFLPPQDESATVMKDENDAIRLVQFSRGWGKITVSSRPRFMTSALLEEEANARLSWYLLSGAGDILFIRGHRPTESIMGRIFQLGNFLVIIISSLVFIVLGFWSVIPLFGVVRGNEERPGKVLAERFLAEGRFLEHFGALDLYRNQYFREIRRRLLKQEQLRDEEIIKRAAFHLGIETSLVEQAIAGGSKKKHFTESIVILKSILERL